MTIPEYDLECDCDFCKMERESRNNKYSQRMFIISETELKTLEVNLKYYGRLDTLLGKIRSRIYSNIVPDCFGNCDCCYPDRIKSCNHANYCKILYHRVDELLIQQSNLLRQERGQVLEDLRKLCMQDESVGFRVFYYIQSLRDEGQT